MTTYLSAAPEPTDDDNSKASESPRKEESLEDIRIQTDQHLQSDATSSLIDTQAINDVEDSTAPVLSDETEQSVPQPPTVKTLFDDSPHKDVSGKYERLTEILENEGIYRSPCGKALFLPTINTDGTETVDRIELRELPAKAVNFMSVIRFSSGRRTYGTLKMGFANGLQHQDIFKQFRQIRHVSKNAAFDENLVLQKQGYNRLHKSYHSGPIFEPISGTKHLDNYLQDVSFQDDASRTNFIAFLIAFLIYKFVGRLPLMVIGADRPGAGKTCLAESAAALLDDTHFPASVGLISSDTEFEKSLGALLNSSGRVIIIDNAKNSNSKKAIESSTLERLTTSGLPATRKIGTSTRIEREPDVFWIMTANQARLSPDLTSRGVFVTLKAQVGLKRTYVHKNLLKHVMSNRHNIIGELVNIVQVWAESGSHLDTSVNHRV